MNSHRVPTNASAPPDRASCALGSAVVATANPAASQAAAEVLKKGGSAADAVVAAQAVLCLVEPHASGFGGGTVVVWHDRASGTSGVIDGLACAPAQVPPRLEVDMTGQRIPRERALTGGWTVGVPGTVKTLACLHGKFGKTPWATLFDAARELCLGGFALPPYLVKTLRELGSMQDEPMAFRVYGQGHHQVQPPGTVVRNPELAQTLQWLAEQGPQAMYDDSPLTHAVLHQVHHDHLPGLMTLKDLQGYQVIERPVLKTQIGDQWLLTAPPPVFGGLAVTQILGLLQACGHGHESPSSSAAQLHRVALASRMAFTDRGAYVGDPAYSDIPTEALLHPDYLQSRSAPLLSARTLAEVHPGRPSALLEPASDGTGLTSAMTSHLVVVDAMGLSISMTTTINQNFGSRVSAAGFYLNNALTNFARVPQAAGQRRSVNAMEPGKRPITSFAPSIVCDLQGHPQMVVGAGGGNRIVGFVSNAILRQRGGEHHAQHIVGAPQVINWSGMTEIEPALAEHAQALRDMGHWTMVRRMDGGTQAAVRQGDLWSAGGDPRRDGYALGI
ncbi:MAG: gamma-glutamyltranspeptidase Ggt [Pseudomonadota bacterium]